MRDDSVIEVDLTAIARNVGIIRRMVGDECAICAVVKADGYGLGAVRVAKCLVQAGAAMLAVYTPRQARELFRAAVSGPVLLLMPLREVDRADELYRGLVCGRLHLAVHDSDHLEMLIRLSERFAVQMPLHLEVDTGMCRGGCNIADAEAVLRRISDHPRLTLAGIYTHFSSSDTDESLTCEQDERLERFVVKQESFIPADCLVHAANTCGTIRSRGLHHTMVRIGQAWAGYGPEMLGGASMIPGAERLCPAVTWSSQVVHVKRIPAGAHVGYGATWTAQRDSRIALVPVGYADGYPFALGSSGGADAGAAKVAVVVPTGDGDAPAMRAAVRSIVPATGLTTGPAIGARREWAPVVGAVSMDQITIDITDLGATVGVGTTVELITADRDAPNHLSTVASIARTTPYEILCRLNPRVGRRYVQSTVDVEVLPAAVARRPLGAA